MVYGSMPFDGSDFRKLRNLITQGAYTQPEETSDAADLIHHLLQPDPAKRATIDDICQHWWFNQGNSDPWPSGTPVDVPSLSQSLSSSQRRESSESEEDSQAPRPLKGILKKPTSPSSSSENEEEREIFLRHTNGSTSPKDLPPEEPKPRKGILKNWDYLSASPVDAFCRGHFSEGSENEWYLHDKSFSPDASLNGTADDAYELDDIEEVLDTLQLNGHGEVDANSTVDSGFVPETELMLQPDAPPPDDSCVFSDTSFTERPEEAETSSGKAGLKGILKYPPKDRPWRYSVTSQGSTSSGDILDFSYDSNWGSACV